jgi:predicted dehydrogenase
MKYHWSMRGPVFCFIFIFSLGGSRVKGQDTPLIRLITLDPGHFHAALVQKYMYPQISNTVNIYAPEGPDLKTHLGLIEKYNSRPKDPTSWKENVYTGRNYFEKMLQEKAGGVVVIAGNNLKKMEYIKKSVAAGMNVLADKPMAVTTSDFNTLKEAFTNAGKKKVLLYDIMTSRYEITNILQKEFLHMPEVFGELEKGTIEDPAVIIVRTHYFLKYVSGAPLIRPDWYFDVNQEGDGIVDVTTHLVDLVQWECFPEILLNYQKDIRMHSARRWPTAITATQFRQVTNQPAYPGFLQKDVKDSILHVYANGEMNYSIRGVHTKITMIWNVQPPEGSGDTHYSCIRGTKAKLVVRQGKEQHFLPTLYIEDTGEKNRVVPQEVLLKNMQTILEKYPGVTLKKAEKGWEVVIPDKYVIGHEQHFALVTQKYLQYLKEGKVPDREVSAMLAKYYTTTQALEKAMHIQ